MTAVLNFTLPKLDVSPGRASAPSAPAVDLSKGQPGAAVPGGNETSSPARGGEFAELVNSRIVKKETGRDGKFDGSGPASSGADSSAEVGESSDQTSSSSASTGIPLTPGGTFTKDGYSEPGFRLASATSLNSTTANAIITGVDTDVQVSNRTKSDGPTIAVVSKPVFSDKLDISAGTLGAVSANAARATSETAIPAATTTSRQDPVTQARITAPLRSADLPTAVSLSAERSTDARAVTGASLIDADDATTANSIRPNQTPGSELTAVSSRAGQGPRVDAASTAAVSEAEIAALSGKDLPRSGKDLPVEQLPGNAQPALAINLKADAMSRSAVADRTRSIGKGLRSTAVREFGDLSGSDRLNTTGSRLILPDAIAKAVTQFQTTTGADANANSPAANSDTQATGLLAQQQAGVDRAMNTRTAGSVPGFDSGNPLTLQLQAGSQEISAQLGNRIRWMGNVNLSSAELKLYPAELGTLEIRITAEDDQARVNFITSTSAAKEMIESSLPRLRELLGQSGLLLEQGDVTHRDLSHKSSSPEAPTVEQTTVDSRESEALDTTLPLYQRSAGEHRVDHFA